MHHCHESKGFESMPIVGYGGSPKENHVPPQGHCPEKKDIPIKVGEKRQCPPPPVSFFTSVVLQQNDGGIDGGGGGVGRGSSPARR